MPQLSTLPAAPAWDHLLAFDFDDTLSLREEDPIISPDFYDWVRHLRGVRQAAWGICTGRSLFQLMEGIGQGSFPFLPDFVVCREREIFFPGDSGRWLPDEKWNRACEKAHQRLFRKARKPLAKVQAYVEEQTAGRWVSVEGDAAGIVTATTEEMDRVLTFMEGLTMPEAVTYERNRIYLRFSHAAFSKGTCLAEVASQLQVPQARILAVGDNYNDLSMLQTDVSGMCGCPVNSVKDVKDFVGERGGKVSEKAGSYGAMEVLGHYFG